MVPMDANNFVRKIQISDRLFGILSDGRQHMVISVEPGAAYIEGWCWKSVIVLKRNQVLFRKKLKKNLTIPNIGGNSEAKMFKGNHRCASNEHSE